MSGVIMGVDPHKLSATIVIADSGGKVLGSGRFATDRVGDAAMCSYVRTWPERVWAVEGANGAGRPLAQRLLSELIPGQRKRDLSALQAKAMLATVRPRDVAGKTRRRIAAEEPPTWS
jgi:transposase